MDEEEFWRQYNETAAQMTESEVEEDCAEDYLDSLGSPTQRTSKYWTSDYQKRRHARRQAREERQRHAMSPPATPPHLDGQQQAPMANRDVPILQLDRSKVRKGKRSSRKAPFCLRTRTCASDTIMLLPKKGMVRYWQTGNRWSYVDMTYEVYLRDFVSALPSTRHRVYANLRRRMPIKC